MTAKQDRVDAEIEDLLIDVDDPNDGGFSNLKLTETIFPDHSQMSNREYRAASKYIERRLNAIRHRIDVEIQNQINEDPDADRTLFKPDFLPYALPIKGVESDDENERPQFWLYFNAARSNTFIKMVIQSLIQKAEGLEKKAQLLQDVFQP